MLKSHKNHRDDRLPFLLTASCEGPPPTTHFQLKLKKPISLWYTSKSRGVVKCYNHFKIGINGPELLHYRSVSQNPFSWMSKILVRHQLKRKKYKWIWRARIHFSCNQYKFFSQLWLHGVSFINRCKSTQWPHACTQCKLASAHTE